MSEEFQQASEADIRDRAEIDRSVRFPVLFFFTSAAAWLFVATIFGFLSALKLVIPELWENCSWMTYGRLFPVHMNALIYGWAMQAGFGIMVWMMARLCRVASRNSVTILVAGHLWNFGVMVGVLSVWGGQGNSIPWLEFPSYSWPILALSYLAITVWLVVMFRSRRPGQLYISQMFLMGAALWFPWIYLTANIIINRALGTGSPVMAAGVNAWFMSNLVYFWFVPVGLGAAYYIVAKIAGRPIYSYYLAKLAFWSLAILAGWTGFQRYLGGPFPGWMSAIGGAATIFALLVVLSSGVNLYLTLRGRMKLMEYSPSLRFTLFGVLMFTVYGILAAVMCYFSVARVLQFSHATIGLDTLAIYGMFSMIAFGAIYFIVPRITEAEWPSSKMINFHFWFSSYGILTIVGFMFAGGAATGFTINDWSMDFMASVSKSNPYVTARAVAWALISVANLAFFYQLAVMFVGKGRKSEGPTLIHKEPGEAGSAADAAGITAETA